MGRGKRRERWKLKRLGMGKSGGGKWEIKGNRRRKEGGVKGKERRRKMGD